MIVYESGDWSLGFICSLRGSTLPKATVFSIPSAIIAAVWRIMLTTYEVELMSMQTFSANVVWSVTMVVLSMLLGFRTNKAYSRFWEGITLVNQMSAEWFEACSNLTAFSKAAATMAPDDFDIRRRVRLFQYTLVRLMSLMHGTALRQIGGYSEEFVVLDVQALDDESMRYLYEFCAKQHINRVEVLLHWIQVLITEGISNKLLVVPPPILTRAFQTLSRGMVNLNNARKLADVPFPFPLSQMVVVLLLIQGIMTPLYVASLVDDIAMSAILTFLPMLGMWSVTFIACQLEQPFGQDPNDLPLANLQASFNASLCMLLDPVAQRAPGLRADACQRVNQLRQHTAGGGSTTDSFKIDFTCRKSKGTWDPTFREPDDEDESLYTVVEDASIRTPRAQSYHNPTVSANIGVSFAEVESQQKVEAVQNARNIVPYLQLDPTRAVGGNLDAQAASMHLTPNPASASAALTESTEASPTPLAQQMATAANFANTGVASANTAGLASSPAPPTPPKPSSPASLPSLRHLSLPSLGSGGGSQRDAGVLSASAATAAEIALSALTQDASTQVMSSRAAAGGVMDSQSGLMSHRSLQSSAGSSSRLRRGSSTGSAAACAIPEAAVATESGKQTSSRALALGQSQQQQQTPPSPAGSTATAVNPQTQAGHSNWTFSSARSAAQSDHGSVAGEMAPTPIIATPAEAPSEPPVPMAPPQPFPIEPVYRPARLNQLSSRALPTSRPPGFGQAAPPSQAAPPTITDASWRAGGPQGILRAGQS